MKFTQRERVARTLGRAPDGVCARWFIHEMYPSIDRIAARISDLRSEGAQIVSEPCDLHRGYDPQTHHIKYRLEDGRLFR